MVYVKVNAKGQVVIPAAIRQRLDIKPGTRLLVVEDEEGVRLQRPTAEAIRQKYVGLLQGTDATEELLRDRACDREREEHSPEERP